MAEIEIQGKQIGELGALGTVTGTEKIPVETDSGNAYMTAAQMKEYSEQDLEQTVAQQGEAIADDSYPAYNTWSAFRKGYAVLYNGTVYRFTSDHVAGEWTGEDAEVYPLAERWRDYCENDYYHLDTFVEHDEGDLIYFNKLMYIEFPYKDGDTVEIRNALSGNAYDYYNFFKGKEFLGTSNATTWSVDLIPEGCDRIKVNGSLNYVPIVIVNGKGINRTSEAYRINNEIATNTSKITQNTEDIADLKAEVGAMQTGFCLGSWDEDELSPESELTVGDREFLEKWDAYLLDTTDNAGETTRPVGKPRGEAEKEQLAEVRGRAVRADGGHHGGDACGVRRGAVPERGAHGEVLRRGCVRRGGVLRGIRHGAEAV